MKSTLFYTIAVLLTIFTTLVSAQERDLIIEKNSVSGANTFVLLIGINKYPRDNWALDYCINDAEGLATVLKEAGVPATRIFVMVDDAENVEFRPSLMNIKRQIERITGLVTENDLLVVAFFGHGVQDQEDGEAYLCPNDIDLNNRNSFLPRKWVYEQIERSPARKKLFIMDACRNEITLPVTRSLVGVRSLADPLGDMESYGFATLASASHNQKSYEDDEYKHGVFSYFLIQGLKGTADVNKDGEVTFNELYNYVLHNTREHVLSTRREAQRPMRGGEWSGDFVLISGIEHKPPQLPISGQERQPTETEPPVRRTSSETANYTLNLAPVALGALPLGWDGPNNAEVNNVGGTRCLTNNDRRTPATLTISNHFNQPGDFVLNFTCVVEGGTKTVSGTITDENDNTVSFKASPRCNVTFGNAPVKTYGQFTSYSPRNANSKPPSHSDTYTITRRGSILSMTCEGLEGAPIIQRSDTFKSLTGFSITIPNNNVGISRFSVQSLGGSETTASPISTPSPPPVVQESQTGERTALTIKGVQYPFRWCPAGTLDNQNIAGFWIAEMNTTQVQWKSITGRFIITDKNGNVIPPSNFSPDYESGSGRLQAKMRENPVIPVPKPSKIDCDNFIAELEKQARAARELPQGYKFAILTAAQWKHAHQTIADIGNDNAGLRLALVSEQVIPQPGNEVNGIATPQYVLDNQRQTTLREAAFQSRELALDIIEKEKIRYTTPRGDRRRAPVTIVSADDKDKCREFLRGEELYVSSRFSEAKTHYDNFLQQYKNNEAEDLEIEVVLLFGKMQKEIGIIDHYPSSGAPTAPRPGTPKFELDYRRNAIVKANPELNVLFQKGYEAAKQKRYSEAKRYYERVLQEYHDKR